MNTKHAATILDAVREKRCTIPVLCAIKSDGARLWAFDLDIEATVDVALPPFIATGDNVIAALKAGAPTLDSGALVVGSERFGLGDTLPQRDWPFLATSAAPFEWRMSAALLLDTLKRVSPALSTEETRYYLNGVFMSYDTPSRSLRFIAVDGHRMHWRDLPGHEPAAYAPEVIIPRKTVAVVMKALKGVAGDVTVRVGPSRVEVAGDGWTIKSKVIDGSFPDYRRVMPAVRRDIASGPARALEAALKPMAKVRGNPVAMTLNGRVALAQKDEDTGGRAADAAGWTPLVEHRVGFNGRYMREAMIAAGGDVIISQEGEHAPMRIYGSDVGIVIMPMRV